MWLKKLQLNTPITNITQFYCRANKISSNIIVITDYENTDKKSKISQIKIGNVRMNTAFIEVNRDGEFIQTMCNTVHYASC